MTASIFERIVKLIPNDRYISRAELAAQTGMSDRYIRRQIERARRARRSDVAQSAVGGRRGMSYEKHTWSAGGETVTTSLIDGHINWFDTDNAITTAWEVEKPKRIRCEYCGCLSEKDCGTCEHCGAAL